MSYSSVEKIRKRIYRMLELSGSETPGLSPLNLFIVGTIVVAALAAVLESEPTILLGNESLFRAAETAFTTVFTIEFLARIWVAGQDIRYQGFLGRLKYLASPMAIIDLLSISPLFLSMLGTEAFLFRILRLLRILRVARLGRFSSAFDAIQDALRSRKYELIMSALIAGVLLLVSSTILHVIEAEAQPDAFGSIPRAMWWSIATLTTVGYGDAYPVTSLGRFFAGMTAIIGIGLIAMPTGILAAAFSDAIQTQRSERNVKSKADETT